VAALRVPFSVAAALQRRGEAAVQFIADGNRGVRVVGRTSTLWVSDNGSVITVMVPLGSLRTGIALRDRHMRDRYLYVARYPTIRLDVPWAAVRRPPEGGSVSAEAEGTLSLHGRSRPVRFTYTARADGGALAVEGGFRIDLRDFGVQLPSFVGIRLHPWVSAHARFRVSEAR
jgi:hypothetical protein